MIKCDLVQLVMGELCNNSLANSSSLVQRQLQNSAVFACIKVFNFYFWQKKETHTIFIYVFNIFIMLIGNDSIVHNKA